MNKKKLIYLNESISKIISLEQNLARKSIRRKTKLETSKQDEVTNIYNNKPVITTFGSHSEK
jgi:hypothetical protein